MNFVDREIARCEEERKAFEAQLLKIEADRRTQEAALAEREALARAGLERVTKELGEWTANRENILDAVKPADRFEPARAIETPEQAIRDAGLVEKQTLAEQTRTEVGITYGEQVLPMSDLPLNATIDLIGTVVAVAQAGHSGLESLKQGREERVDQAILENPLSPELQQENAARAAIEAADREKRHQNDVEKAQDARDKQHAGIEDSYLKQKERLSGQLDKAREGGSDDRAQELEARLKRLDELRVEMKIDADRQAARRLEEIQQRATDRLAREAEERQRQERDGR